ncbi:MAG: STING domain-containing protein [Rhodothermales bacterium]|nr:STING domain-containing protein [Rhodothermales bacterium]
MAIDKKPNLFIGSSTEGLPVARAIGRLVEDRLDVKVWEDAFFPGDHPLDGLRREVLRSDFALMVATPDDVIELRQQVGYSARTNILFELGLFMGALGRSKSLMLVITDNRGGERREVLLPSDLNSITQLRATLERGLEYDESLSRVATQLVQAIERASKTLEITLLPSTSLAIGYFNNFVLQVCRKLYGLKDFRIADQVVDLTGDMFDFHIVLPNEGSDASHEGFAKFVRLNRLTRVELEGESKSRTFPFFVDSTLRNGRAALYDYPTTLRAAREAILLAVPENATDEEIQELEQREIVNFERTLRMLLRRPAAADFRDNVHILYLNELDDAAP